MFCAACCRALELARQAFGLLLEFLRRHLVAAATAAALLLLARTAFLQLLLTLGQFLQLSQSFIDILRTLLLHFSALDGFILVFVLIQFQFEEIGEIFGVLRAATTAASAALRHLDFIEQGVGAH